MKLPKLPKKKYSGAQSQTFWRCVNESNSQAIYVLGCRLQEAEDKVFARLKKHRAVSGGRRP